MPKAQDAANWTNPPLFKRPAGASGPLVSTLAGRRDGSRPVDEPDPEPAQGIIYQTGFEEMDDFTSTMYGDDNPIEAGKGDILPEGYFGLYQGTQWSPETGYPNKHASLEILASNADKARGGTGKSAVFWRESYTSSDWTNWGSDSQLIRLLGAEYPQIYCEMYIRFSDNWWHRTDDGSGFASKLFRVGHWNGEDGIYNGNSGTVNPRFIWQYALSNYGVRSVYTMRQGPPPNSTELSYAGSYNYTSMTAGMGPGGSDPQVPNQDGEGFLSGTTTHNQVFGPGDTWTKVAFFLKMNSAPGVADGVFKHFHNDVRIRNWEDVVWVADNGSGDMPGWNYFAIGGNSYFQPFPNEDQFEDWRAIDDLVISTDLPEGLE